MCQGAFKPVINVWILCMKFWLLSKLFYLVIWGKFWFRLIVSISKSKVQKKHISRNCSEAIWLKTDFRWNLVHLFCNFPHENPKKTQKIWIFCTTTGCFLILFTRSQFSRNLKPFSEEKTQNHTQLSPKKEHFLQKIIKYSLKKKTGKR